MLVGCIKSVSWMIVPIHACCYLPGFVAMGFFRTSFTLMFGMGCGVYVAQNYDIPNVKKLFNTYMFLAKHIEETYRKPKRDD